jgi:hypothetical protein
MDLTAIRGHHYPGTGLSWAELAEEIRLYERRAAQYRRERRLERERREMARKLVKRG